MAAFTGLPCERGELGESRAALQLLADHMLHDDNGLHLTQIFCALMGAGRNILKEHAIMASTIYRILFSWLLLIASAGSQAAMVVPLGLDRLHGGAEFIFLGECLSNTIAYDRSSDMVVTYTNFEVIEAFKGSLSGTHSIKQVGGSLPGSGMVTKFAGVPQFEVGMRYVLFLPPVSKLGFSTPVGMEQGLFHVRVDSSGAQVISSGRDVGELLQNLPKNRIPSRVADKLSAMPDKDQPAQAKARAEIHLDDFRSIMHGMGQ